jgi:hypothetical protein
MRVRRNIEKSIKQRLSKSFELPLQMAVYVPSTKDKNVNVTKKEMDERVLEVKSFLANLFGGFNSVKVEGGFESSDKGLIEEDAVRVVAFSTEDGFENKFEKLVYQVKMWCKEWSQESIGLEFENDLFYIESDSKYANGGMISVDYDGEVLKYKIDTDDKYIEVDEVTKEFLSDIALVMDRNFRKLKDTYIFWYDDMSDSDIKELEEVFQTSLTKFAKGGELEDDTFVMLFKAYGFVEKRGSYGTRTFYNVQHNAKIYYDPKYRSISGYVGGGEGNDEVIPYSVDGVLDFFIEHDITESDATPFAKGGKVLDLKDVYNDLRSRVGRLQINDETDDYINCDIRDWGNWEHDYEDYERDEEDFEDDDSMILSNSSAKKMQEIIEEIRAKYPTAKIQWGTSEKNYIDFNISRKMAFGGNVWDEDLNVYTLVSSKEYFGSDTASDKRRWFRRNGRGLTRDQAKRMAQDYIDRYGKERVYIGNIRHYR